MIETLRSLDRDILLAINSAHTPLLDKVMWVLSQSWHTVLLVIACGYSVYKRVSPRRAAEFVLGCALIAAATDLTSNGIKHSVKRYRPTHNLHIRDQVHVVNDYRGGKVGFVSSHASNSFAVVTFIFLTMKYVPARFRALLFLYPAAIGYSRIYLGVHYPGDIFGGASLGVLFGWMGYGFMNRFFYAKREQVV